MILFIDDAKTIADLQDKFNLCFQSLKIEFYNSTDDGKGSPSKNSRLHPDHQIGEIRKEHNKGILEIKSWYDTRKVEQEFRELYGLQVHIFFSSNHGWIRVTSSDDRTLAALNKVGELAGRMALS